MSLWRAWMYTQLQIIAANTSKSICMVCMYQHQRWNNYLMNGLHETQLIPTTPRCASLLVCKYGQHQPDTIIELIPIEYSIYHSPRCYPSHYRCYGMVFPNINTAYWETVFHCVSFRYHHNVNNIRKAWMGIDSIEERIATARTIFLLRFRSAFIPPIHCIHVEMYF